MKKTSLYIVILMILTGILISCGKKVSVVNEYGFYSDVDAAMENAMQKNQEILVIVTMDGDDQYSEAFLNTAKTSDFKTKIADAYSVVHFDFSKKAYMQTVVDETASKKIQIQAMTRANQLQKNSQFASLLNVQGTPSFYLLTKEQYFIAELQKSYVPANADQLLELIDLVSEKTKLIEDLVEKSKTGTNLERIAAIDELFELTDYNLRVFLADLVETVIKLDKNNESGLLGKYIFADAENTALNYFTDNNLNAAVDSYIRITSNPNLDAQYKQQAFFMAAYFMTAAGSDETSTIIQYFNYAIQAAPESELVPTIRQLLSYLEQTGQR